MNANNVDVLVDTDWLQENLKNVVILHVTYDADFKPTYQEYRSQWFCKWPQLFERFESEEYNSGHIPGAVHFSINCCVMPGRTERHYLYNNAQITPYIQKLAIFPDEHIVVYSSGAGNSMMYAAKARWILKIFGFGKVSVLNGGLDRWRKEKKPLTTEVIPLATSSYMPQMVNLEDLHVPFTELQIGKPHEIADLENLHNINYMDCRVEAEYKGEVDPRQFQHEDATGSYVPHSKHLSYLDVLTFDGLMAPKDMILKAVNKAEYIDGARTILFCYDGLRCNLVGLAMEYAGLPAPLIFSGGLYEVERRKPRLINGDVNLPDW